MSADPDSPPRAGPPWPMVTVVVLVLAGQVVGITIAPIRTVVLALTVLLLDTLGAVYSLRASRRPLVNGIPWVLIGAGRIASALTTVGIATSAVTGSSAWWWFGSLARLVTLVLLAAGIGYGGLQMLRGTRLRAMLFEVVTVLAGGFMLVWYFILEPIVATGAPDGRWAETVGVPVGDLLLLAGVTAMLLRGAMIRLAAPVVAIAGGALVYLISDVIGSATGIGGRQQHNSVVASVVVTTGSLLLTLAPMMLVTDPTRRYAIRSVNPAAWSMHLPAAALGTGCVLLLVVTVRQHQMTPWGGLVCGLIVMTSAVTVRQMISIRDTRAQVITDPLTGLANRTGLDAAVTRAVRRAEPVALLVIDLDGFKLVNDAHGHAAGDTMLVEFAHHLRSSVRPADTCARIGGDEFVVLLTGVASEDQAVTVAQHILGAAAANPVRLTGATVPIRASVGVTLGGPADGTKALLRRADLAMYHCKRAGNHGWALYEPSMVDRRADDARLAEDLADALARDELTVLFQPLVDLTSDRPIAAEALIRWHHPVRGMVSPVRFIPIAERTGTITAIGLYVLEHACRRLHEWHLAAPSARPLHVSVNLSPRQLQEPTLVDDVLAVLARTSVAPHDLVLEVTESALVDGTTGIAALRALRAHGIRIAIDDFGTGYSSLHYLTRLPVDILKIDRSFVAELDGTAEGSAITEAIIRLSHVLDLSVVAEGVETQAQAAELLALGCDTGQGYLFARPLPPAEVADLLTGVTVR